jgi:hypothetical protein
LLCLFCVDRWDFGIYVRFGRRHVIPSGSLEMPNRHPRVRLNSGDGQGMGSSESNFSRYGIFKWTSPLLQFRVLGT